MPRGYPNTDRTCHWNERWLTYLRKIACNIVSRYPNTSIDKDDLVNAAWINSIRRLQPDTPIGIVGTLARRSMYQYLLGRRRQGRVNPQLHTDSLQRDHSDWLTAPASRYDYDDADEIIAYAMTLDVRARFVFLSLLRGTSQKTIAQCLHLTEGRITQIRKQQIEPPRAS